MSTYEPGAVVFIPGVGRAICTGKDDVVLVGRRSDQQRNLSSFTNVRPLVVIDPEDWEQAKRLQVAVNAEYSSKGCEPEEVVRMQNALRSLTRPPEPDEPTDPAARVYCVVAGGRTEWARVPGLIDGTPGEHPVWVNGWGGRRSWAQLVEDYDVEVVLP